MGRITNEEARELVGDAKLRSWRTRMYRAVASLNRILTEVQEDLPHACWYVSEDVLNLMTRQSQQYDDDHWVGIDDALPQHDKVLGSARIRRADCGDW